MLSLVIQRTLEKIDIYVIYSYMQDIYIVYKEMVLEIRKVWLRKDKKQSGNSSLDVVFRNEYLAMK